jgi:hypothetical protein
VLAAISSAVLVYVAVGALIAAALVALHAHDVTAIQRRVATGSAGMPVFLLGLAAVPNVVLYVVAFLTGAGFQIGRHTSVSILSSERGDLPLFPVLGAVPSHTSLIIGLALAVITAGLAVRQLSGGGRWTSRLLDVAVLAAGCGLALALLSALAAGSLGPGSLSRLGARFWLVGPMAAGAVLLSASAWLGLRRLLEASSVQPRVRLRLILGSSLSAPEAADAETADADADADAALPASATEPAVPVQPPAPSGPLRRTG